MYKQSGSKNTRYKKASQGNYAKGSSGGGYKKGTYNSKSSGKRKYYGNKNRSNRRMYTQQIAHSMYISKASEVVDNKPYIPGNSFHDFNLHELLSKNIFDRDYVNPTKIQDQAIPQILKGSDLLGIGSTGSGKTGAFLIPMINKAIKNSRERVLIICPTRELASQINNEFKKFTKGTRLRMVLVIGGAPIGTQISLLKHRPQFVVATPGRLMDLEKRRCIYLSDFNNIVLDEVDQMLDMGFVTDIKDIIAKLSPQRQSLFFSATLSKKEELIANTLLNNPVRVESDKQCPLKSIDQDIVKVKSKGQKLHALHEILQKQEVNKTLVFSRTRRGADEISRELRNKGISADSLHGDKPQRKRSKILTNFRQDKVKVLIATDVAARGIDIPDITHVINYDEPANYNAYIHRIGRTGRIGKKGTALTFVFA